MGTPLWSRTCGTMSWGMICHDASMHGFMISIVDYNLSLTGGFNPHLGNFLKSVNIDVLFLNGGLVILMV